MKIIAIHQWKHEDLKTVTKKVIEVLQTPPSGISLLETWISGDEAWCIWEGASPELGKHVKAYLDSRIPEMYTEVKEVIQWFPPSADIYAFIHGLASQ